MNNSNLAVVGRSPASVALTSVLLVAFSFAVRSQSVDSASDDAWRAYCSQYDTAEEPTAEEEDEQLLKCLIGYAVSYDIAVVAGLVPFPPIGKPGEIVEYGINILLKRLPARLIAPADQEIYLDRGNGPGYTVDGCGIDFPLLSAQAEYSNLFGVVNFRGPYTQRDPLKVYPWRNFSDPDDSGAETRWGFLRAPRLYHANSDVKLEIQTPYTVRKYDQGTDTLGDPFTPIDTFSDSPQQVYLPIGQHGIGWQATTQFNLLSDVAVPGVLLAYGVLSEIGKGAEGVEAGKTAKKSGFGDEVAEEALDPEGAKRLSDGIKRFNDVWTQAFEERQARKKIVRPKGFLEKLRENIIKKAKSLLGDSCEKVLQLGIKSLDGGTRDALKGLVRDPVANAIGAVYSVADDQLKLNGGEVATKLVCGIGVLGAKETVNIKNAGFVSSVIKRVLELYGAEGLLDFFAVDSATRFKIQTITVYDSVPPTINVVGDPLPIEAADFGGTRLYRKRAELLELATAASSDNCGRTPEIILNAPELLPLGLQQIEFTARDRGPNPDDGQDYAPKGFLPILVRDTQPPLLLAPPSKVIIRPVGDSPVPLDDAEIGDAVAVDLVDVQPQVINNAPGVFPANSRTRIRWTATDASGNSAESSQLITVKDPDTNTRPTANGTNKSALTAEPVMITLTANDLDVLPLDGQPLFDPLFFKIESQPQHGQFIAPLYPFFIEDYRTRPNGNRPDEGLGQGYNPVQYPDVSAYVASTYCDSDRPTFTGEPPRSFVHLPLFVHVTDDGIRYVLDKFFVCGDENGRVEDKARFSKWGPDGEFLGQLRTGSSPDDYPLGDAFRVDRDGFLYYITRITTSDERLDLIKCATDWTANSLSSECPTSRSFTPGQQVGANKTLGGNFSYARIDSGRDIIYLVANGIFAFDNRTGGSFLGEVGPKDADGVVLEDWFGKIPSLEVGSDGALYANDMERDRIHKIGPASVNENGEIVLGEYVGWAGKCTASGYGDCEVDLASPELGRSFGYSCTYDVSNPNAPDPIPTCTVAPGARSACDPENLAARNFDQRSGCRQGQFDTPKYISLDPNDILYVADYENARIQRFGPDGSFAGEAVSEGSGVNKGSRPSFILGNMGQPESVAVNSSQFFVVDRRERFVYVFGTLPFKDVKPTTAPGASMEATVTYVSDQRFPNPNTIGDDFFTFSVTDGLDRSEAAKVTVTVSRSFRPPQAASLAITTAEDTPVDFELPAGDPDGVIGKDPDGLDMLTYRLTRWPENGSLSGNAESWTYTPYPDFSGKDSIGFIVNDGLEDSNEGILTFDVTAVRDPPVVAIEIPERVALGFPTQVTVTFTDDRTDTASAATVDGSSAGYSGLVEWGDGLSDITGDFVNIDGDVQSTGVVVIAPSNGNAEGRALAEHTFEQAGDQTIKVCVADRAALEACDQVDVTVESLVVLGAGAVFYDEPLEDDEVTQQEVPDGRPFTVEITLVNGEPSVGPGLAAEDVVFDLLLPADLNVQGIAIEQGACIRNDANVQCTLGQLVPSAEVKLRMTATGPGGLIYDEDRAFEATLSTSSDALVPELGLSASVKLVADRADTDADGMSDTFETTFGLNPASDDSAGDVDGDALTNVEEYNQQSSPVVADTDGDGVSDGAEVAAGSDPLFDDIPPVLNSPADIEVNATGTLTLVSLGVATAEDFTDGSVEVFGSDPGPFPPGHNLVTWSAFDAAGNRADAYQFVNVVPIVNFQIDQTVAEGSTARAIVELNGPAVTYPVTIPFDIAGSATNPEDHDGVSGEIVIASGMSAEIPIQVVKDGAAEPDETIVLTMATPGNAVAGNMTTHTITISEQNRPPEVEIAVEQQGRPTTTVVSSGGLIALIADVRDDPAQDQSFDWSASDSALIDPIAVNDPSYLLEPAGLSAGLYSTRVSVTDNGVPSLNTPASSLVNVANEPLMLQSGDDTDGDGISDAAEGPADGDGDRIANYLDDISNSNLLRLAADGRLLETTPGLKLRLGATTFTQNSAYVAVKEQDVGRDIDFGYASDVWDFEVAQLAQGSSARIVIPLANSISAGAVYRRYANGQWQDFIDDAQDSIASAPGGRGACPPAVSNAYTPGLNEPDGCVQLTLTDGGPNDADGVRDGVVRIIGGLAAPVGAIGETKAQATTVLAGDGDAVMARFILHSDSGDTLLNSLTLQASGNSDDLLVDDVLLIKDVDRDGEWGDDDLRLASGKYTVDDGELTLQLNEPLEVPAGDTDLLIVYVFGELEE